MFGLGLDKEELRAIIREEIKKILDEEKQFSISKTYNEKTQIVATSFYEKIDEGYWLNVITRGVGTSTNIGDVEIFYEHIRTDANFDKLGFDETNRANLRTMEKLTDKTKDIKSNGGIILIKE